MAACVCWRLAPCSLFQRAWTPLSYTIRRHGLNLTGSVIQGSGLHRGNSKADGDPPTFLPVTENLTTTRSSRQFSKDRAAIPSYDSLDLMEVSRNRLDGEGSSLDITSA